MILLKANSELKAIFQKLINTIGRDIQWTEVFVINNNNLILAGKDRVLFFDFGTKKLGSNLMELQLKEDSIEQITGNELLGNALNMTLYVFGKWEKIKGLTVEKDYSQLNKLFGYFLKEIDVEAVLTENNFRFYKDGKQLTYEDIIQEILEKQKKEDQVEPEESGEDEVKEDKNDNKKYNLGLWHKMVWTSDSFSFTKEELSESNKRKHNIAYNFHIVGFHCPICGENLSMVIYPTGKELLIETDEKGVYLARAYTCGKCHRFFTPKPHMLLVEGNVYQINFEDDAEAYEDYLDLMGQQGERTSNCNFNEYEADYNKKNQRDQEQLEEICSDMATMSDRAVYELMDKMDSGFYPQKSTEKYYKAVNDEQESRGYQLKDIDYRNDFIRGQENIKGTKQDLQTEEQEDGKQPSGRFRNDDGLTTGYKAKYEYGLKSEESTNKESTKKENTKKEYGLSHGKDAKPDYHIKNEDNERPENCRIQEGRYQSNNRSDSNIQPGNYIKTESSISSHRNQNEELSSEKLSQVEDDQNRTSGFNLDNPFDQISDDHSNSYGADSDIYNSKEKDLFQKADSCKDKNYANIVRVMEEIKKENCNESVKQSILQTLSELLEKRGKKELASIIAQIPGNVSKKQYSTYIEAFDQYKAIDTSEYVDYLNLRRDEAEKQEIAAYIKRSNTKNRASLMELFKNLKKEDFKEKNAAPFLEQIHDKIYAMDEAVIRRIYPEPEQLSFKEGLEAYKEISSEDLLPELKGNILIKIDNRLMKIKKNESEQLVNKLSKEIKKLIPEHSGIYYYDVRKGMRDNSEEEEARIIEKALNTYAADRGRYEFPILICDTSAKGSGGRGFVLTPDHIFYNSMLDAGVIDITEIDQVSARKGIIHKGLIAETNHSGRVKIANPRKIAKLEAFASVLNDFVVYLKEKPESRDITYIVKEKHNVICCYRCGYVYKGGDICPKCGAKFNE